MNDRINDLMYRAGLTAQGCWDNMDDYDREAILKFAELIVRGCIVDFYRRYLDTTSNEDITSQVERYVQEHFGVK